MAIIGQALAQPESGWKRIEETDSNFKLTGTWTSFSSTQYSGSSLKVGSSLCSIEFSFTGRNLRFIGRTWDTSYTTKADVYIDGKLYGSFSQTGSQAHRILNFEALNLPFDNHYVKIVNTINHLGFDAIDIDEKGVVYPYDDSIIHSYKKTALKNPTTNQNYSLSDNTLIHLPNASNKNMILFGMEQGKEIALNVPFNKKNYVNDTPVGKVFTQGIESSNTLKVREIKKDNGYTPIIKWYETKMTSNTTPTPLVANGSSLFNTNYDYYKPFNGTNIDWSDSWTSNNPKAHIQLDFNELKKVNMISITTWNEPNNTSSPKRFSISASKNGTDFETILNEIILSEWAYNTEKIFFLNEDVNYRVFRINVEESFGASYTSIGQIKFGYKEVN